jgi:hypothetical protein
MDNFETGPTRSVAHNLGGPLGCAGLTGCLGALLMVVVVAGFVGGIFFFIMSSFKSSPVYQQAMDAVRSDRSVAAALGTPIDSGWLITGSISEQGLSGDADLIIPISGPRRGGTLYASARKGNGIWQFYTLAVKVDGDNEVIQLQR